MEKYFNSIIYQREGCRLWREINTLSSISSLTDRVFPIFRQLFPRRHNKQKHKQMIKDISVQGINTIIQVKKK